MSAVSTKTIDCGETRTFLFEQTVPVQSYLIAIAIGNLVSKTLSPISKVWSEPEEIDKAAYEFEQVKIINILIFDYHRIINQKLINYLTFLDTRTVKKSRRSVWSICMENL